MTNRKDCDQRDEILTPLMFSVPGVPVAQPRVKATSRGKHTRVYTPTKNAKGASNGIVEFKEAVKLAAAQFQGRLIAGPISIDLKFIFPRPKYAIWKNRPMPRIYKTTKPDIDNLFKAATDAMTGIIWEDDDQICVNRSSKWFAAAGEEPHVEVQIIAL